MSALIEQLFQLIAALASFASAGFVLKKNAKYIGNRFMALAFLLFGVYISSLLIYGLIRTPVIVHIFFRIGVIAQLSGMLVLFFTMQIMVHSSAWLAKKKHTIPLIVGLVAWSIWIIFAPLTIISLDPVNTSMALPPLLALVIGSLFLLTASMVSLYRFGIKGAKGREKNRMYRLLIGLGIDLCALLLAMGAQLEAEGILLDIIFFVILAAGLVVIASGFLGKPREN